MKNTKRYVLYIIVTMLVLVIPFAGMVFPPADTTSAEKRDLAAWPATRLEGGSLNTEYLSGMGDYFQDHFAFRSQIIGVNSLLKTATVKSTVQDQVIIGQDGWLFYHGTMNDYLGRELLSERELYDVVHNLSLMQDYAKQNGSQFVFTIAPNKNSLYGQHMPYNYMHSAESNAQNLKPLLNQAEIIYADLFYAFSTAGETLYFERDSHWNNKGAVLVYNTVMDTLEIPHETYKDAVWEARSDHIGDIYEMLYIMYYEEEIQYYSGQEFAYVNRNDIVDNMDAWIETGNPQEDGCLLMYRDSFGESLVPLFAEAFGQAYFSRLTPYNLANIPQYHPDVVVIEKVERSLIDLAVRAPILPGPIVENLHPTVMETQSTIETDTDGPYLVVSGSVDLQVLQDKSEIYIAVQGMEADAPTTYQASYLTNSKRTGNGYALYLKKSELPPGPLQLQLIVSGQNGQQYTVQVETVQTNQEE